MNHSKTMRASGPKTMRATGLGIAARPLVAIALAGLLAAGCGSSEDKAAPEVVKKAADPAAEKVAQAAADAAAAAESEAKNYEDMANAVVTSKSAAAVDLKYDVLAKPEVGQTFEVELAFLPRLSADALEVEVGDMPGLTITGERTHKFVKVATGEPHKARVQVRADAEGLYYLSVIAKMATQVQTEARAFSVPIVVGKVPAAAQKPAPPTDATGQPIESMPAKES